MLQRRLESLRRLRQLPHSGFSPSRSRPTRPMQQRRGMNRLQRRDVPWREPVMVATQLAALYGEEGLVWLDGDGSALGRWVTLGVAPVETVCCRGCPGEPGASNPFEALRQLDVGHWTGWLSYEAAAWSEPGNAWCADAMPSLWIARHDPILRFDLQQQLLWIEGTNPRKN